MEESFFEVIKKGEPGERSEFLHRCFARKTRHWKYEDEYRAFRDGKGHELFPSADLVEVVFGARAEAGFRNEVLKFISLSKSNPSIKEARLQDWGDIAVLEVNP